MPRFELESLGHCVSRLTTGATSTGPPATLERKSTVEDAICIGIEIRIKSRLDVLLLSYTIPVHF